MKNKLRMLSTLLIVFVLLTVGLTPAFAYGQAAPNLNDTENNTGSILQFGLLSEKKLWVLSTEGLFLSDDGGKRWTDISPSQSLEGLSQVNLHKDGQGTFIVVTPGDDFVYAAVYKTNNYGKNWEKIKSNLQFALGDSHAAPVGDVYTQWLNANEGWLMAKRATGIQFSQGVLLQTKDGGKHWTALPSPSGERFAFLDSKIGFLRQHSASNTFYYTLNGGKTWQEDIYLNKTLPEASLDVGLPILASDGGMLMPIEILFEDNSRQMGLYYTQDNSIKTLFSDNFSVIKHRIPESEIGLHPSGFEAKSALNLDLETESLVFASHNLGLAMFFGGSCAKNGSKNHCRYVRELHLTKDGGKSWQLINLPDGSRGQGRYYEFEDPQDHIEHQTNNDLIGKYTGQAFDAANIPTLPQLQTWFSQSPYRAVNLYIGGISRYGENKDLNEDYINQISHQGWRLIPTWVGYQAPCTTFRNKFPYDPNEAYAHGVMDATQAKARMLEYGLLDANGQNGLVYLDLEHFDINNVACMTAVKAYLTGWTTKMTEFNIMGGLYATSSSVNKGQFYNIQPPPPVVWLAEWRATPGYYPYASAYGLRHIADGYWNKLRIRQYSGGSNETWGNVRLNIDPNIADGLIMKKTNLPPTKPFVMADYFAEKGIEPYYKTQVNVFIAAFDYAVGIKNVYFKIDNGQWRDYQPFGVNGSGLKTVSFYAVNNAGLSSDVKTISFYVDNQPPKNPMVKSHGCPGFVNGIPQPICNDANFVLDPGFDAGVGLHPTETYQMYWGTNPNGINENASSTLLSFDPNPIPKNVPYYLRVRSQDKHNIWSTWQTIFVLHYNPDFGYMYSFPMVNK